ncbi:MAG: hypothetical protein WCO80_00265 [Betaproteobacteria bacterium]|jgi:hypothetical protein|nr:hypothetical protein [Betaproteobacteria bacterium]NBT68995.1 hypothetical protein [Betaproteobacteria bacterium]NBY07750.1 hypothetical protein [Betaproteobacteria bacterium]
MKNTSLPSEFKAFEKWVPEWSIPHEAGRFNKRVSTPVEQINLFVEDVYPHMEKIIDFLNQIPTSDPDQLKPPERRLFDMALMWMEASIPADLDWEINDIEDAWEPKRLEFFNPSYFPEPTNRAD